ncbi:MULTISPECIES: pentapeptide repeat-containing protein [Synechocystis]|uniref:Pentapeptide repeat-containing protein n=1 Tax=Synechocystis salina LEGE 00031 TaxID=1828736 RepID=A0ABR9VWD0_9SYNC|nr:MULTISPECIES: pentapeptide repeat-containing protein [Synechocystis]MBE9194993.1 pentapeptide repeat-containing protein [Synechocystis sp. LEGE 06083]MBE9242655.1 pentapeptide repeat-containing protein [Synechocystis salina LEGE 00041]MBE9255654.1 pentapeptide repeat-containing protein [Synechocystis salina LEGE 00031]
MKLTISTNEFYRIIESNIVDPKNNEELSLLINADLSKIQFKEHGHIYNLNLSRSCFDNVDLYNVEIHKCNLSGASLRQVNLSRSKISHVNFTDTDLSGANLAYVKFSQCIFKNTNFENANMEGVDFDSIGFQSRDKFIKIENAKFDGAILKKANLRGYNPKYSKSCLDLTTSSLKNVDLVGALYDLHTIFPSDINPQKQGALLITPGVSLENMDLSFTNLYRANLSGANLKKANLTGAMICSANMSGTNLSEAIICYEKSRFDKDLYANLKLSHSNLQNATIVGIKPDNTLMYMDGADFRKAKLIDCGFTYMELNGALFANSVLNGFDFNNSKLRGADFCNASLRGCDFSSADLRGANFDGADLSGANLKFSQLNSTDLSKANINGVNFQGAQLEGAKMPPSE